MLLILISFKRIDLMFKKVDAKGTVEPIRLIDEQLERENLVSQMTQLSQKSQLEHLMFDSKIESYIIF